jgi:acetoin utilization deacetylase AcuC-like enzyme
MIANNYCEGRLLSMLEGGYDINALEQSILTHIKILQT